jgi:hypothetical protein
MNLRITVIMLAMGLNASAQDFQSDYSKFNTYVNEGKFGDCITLGNKLLQTTRHPVILYKLAQCYCQTDSFKKSAAILHELAVKGLPYKIEENKNLQKLTAEKQYPILVQRFTINRRSIQNSDNAFTLNDPRLIPEGIAATSNGKRFFVSSLAQQKIVEYDLQAGQSDLITSGQNGILMVLGMKVSADNKSIWVCSATEKDSPNGYSGIFGFNLSTGALINKYILDHKTTTHLFNDLVIAADSIIYFTDSKDGKVFKLNRRDGVIAPLVKDQFYYPNGIALDEKNAALYVADHIGIRIINLNNNTVSPLEMQVPTWLNGIDGLYFYKNSLIGIQSVGNNTDRIVRLYLNKSGQQVVRVQVLQSFHPDFIAGPTTGTIVNDSFYYIANSHVENLQPDGSLIKVEELKKPLIKKIRLSR